MTSVIQVMFVGLAKPLKTEAMNYMEILNEILTLLIMYHIFCFTDFVPDPEVRYALGYTCLAFNFNHLLANVYFIMRDSLKDAYNHIII